MTVSTIAWAAQRCIFRIRGPKGTSFIRYFISSYAYCAVGNPNGVQMQEDVINDLECAVALRVLIRMAEDRFVNLRLSELLPQLRDHHNLLLLAFELEER